MVASIRRMACDAYVDARDDGDGVRAVSLLGRRCSLTYLHTFFILCLANVVYTLLYYLLDDTARIAYGQCAFGYVLVDDAARTDDAARAYGDARQHAHLGPYPHIVAYGDGAGVFKASVALFYIEGMAGGVEATVGGYEHIVAEGHRGFVQYHAVDVGVKVLAYLDVVSVVAVERLFYQETLACLAQHLSDEVGLSLRVGRTQMVVFVAERFARLSLGQ